MNSQFRKSIPNPFSLISTLQQNSPKPTSPFSLFDQTKLLESHIVSLLNTTTTFPQIKAVHCHVIRKGLQNCCYVITKLIRSLTSINVPIDPYQRRIFDQVNYKNPFIYTALIRGYSLHGSVKDTIFLYNRMRRERIGPVSFTFSALFKACSAKIDVDLGRQIHTHTIIIGGFDSDLFVGNTMIDFYVKCGFLKCARKVFDEMLERDTISWTTLIVAYTKNGDMGSAGDLFSDLPIKDMVAWTAMVTGFAQNAKPKEALDFLKKMQNENIETDEVTLVGAISACAQLGATNLANWVCDLAERSGFEPENNVVIGSAMIDMYSKCGSVEDAYRIFERMRERNVFTYSSMIVGYAMHGRANAAIYLFEKMVKTEIKPNGVTFVGVLTACSHVGMVEYGRNLFNRMEKCYGVTPNVDHYACMVDLLGRAGKLNEALDLINTMKIDPHGGVWGALLGACRIYNNPDIAEIAASHLFKIEPKGIGNYLLLSNIYASARRWDDVARIRKLMRTKGLKKNPGCSWTEGEKGVIHEFFAGNTNHPKSKEIKQELEDILRKLILNGYQLNLNSVPYDLIDDEKKRILMSHSEKMALAFGLLTTSAGTSIRIVKNLRICEDCHSFMCGASRLYGREIVVRDNMRFHHFSDGACSCGNFW